MKKFEVWEEHDKAFIRTWGILTDCSDCGIAENCSPQVNSTGGVDRCWRPKGVIMVWEDEEI